MFNGNKKTFEEFFFMTDKYVLEFLKHFSNKYNKKLFIIPRSKKQETKLEKEKLNILIPY